MTINVEILCLGPADAALLGKLFEQIAADPLSSHFHPHPFTMTEAHRICNHSGQDKYLALRVDDNFLAYGMLRGWDAGFSIPSLGIYVAPKIRRSGAARLLMEHLHLIARLSDSTRIYLKVYPDNLPAYKLYLSLGYVFASSVDPEGQMVGILDL